MFYSKVIIYQHFLQETQLLLVFVRLKTLVLFFLCFSPFCEFQCPFHKNTFALTCLMGMFYFILVWWGLKSIKLKKSLFFPPIFNKFAIQNNPLIQLYLMFHKTDWKSENFKVIVLAAFQQLRKWLTGAEGERQYVRFVFIIIFVCTDKFIFFSCFTHFFSSAISLIFFFIFSL